ncbi:MAG: right-handed parallel beta-helix repeat-containing protein [Candidatus Thermoplasmatota archaeon]|nr:right-handed parallel beta-helix repeat-containing protein [Candidatus Thermoplasmatota archaeon]
MSKKIILLIILFCLIFAVVPVNTGVTEGEQVFSRAGIKGLTVHEPIYINGNSDFASQATIEGWAGDGTEADPYIIENWDIDASTADGIRIENTDVYFIIKNCVIHDGKSDLRRGISFYKVTHGKIDKVTAYNNYGIHLSFSSNNNISANQIYNNNDGAYLLSSSNNNLSANRIYNNDNYGIKLVNSSNNLIIANRIYNNSYDGILLSSSSNNNTITNCEVYNNFNSGILLSYSSNNKITNSAVYNNDDGIFLWDSSNNNTITNNAVYNNSYGIRLDVVYSSNNNLLYHNNLVNNTYNAYDECINYWNNSTEGNYWSDYNGSDTDGNGIGNTPYNISGGNNKDNYPLMSQIKMADENNPPTLSNGTVSPLSGYLDTVFKFVVTYTDVDNDTPAYVNVIIDNTDSYNMTKQNISDDNYKDGCVYENSTTLPIGSHFYYFNASDGINMTVYPSASCINITPIYGLGVTEKEEQKTWVQQGIYYFILVIIIIAVEIVVSAVFLIMRKRTMILKCPKCGTIFKVKRKKEAFKVECPTCGAEGTIKSVPEKKTSPKKPTRTLRCPRCEQAFTVEEKTKPFSVKCPHCGKEGTIR